MSDMPSVSVSILFSVQVKTDQSPPEHLNLSLCVGVYVCVCVCVCVGREGVAVILHEWSFYIWANITVCYDDLLYG
jgi:hypothetical protein